MTDKTSSFLVTTSKVVVLVVLILTLLILVVTVLGFKPVTDVLAKATSILPVPEKFSTKPFQGNATGGQMNYLTLGYMIWFLGFISALSDIRRHGITVTVSFFILTIFPYLLNPNEMTIALYIGSAMQFAYRQKGLTWGLQLTIAGIVALFLAVVISGIFPPVHDLFRGSAQYGAIYRFLGYVLMIAIQCWIAADKAMVGTVVAAIRAYQLFLAVATGQNFLMAWKGQILSVLPWDVFANHVVGPNFAYSLEWYFGALLLIFVVGREELSEIKFFEPSSILPFIVTSIVGFFAAIGLNHVYGWSVWPIFMMVFLDIVFGTAISARAQFGSLEDLREAFKGLQDISEAFVGAVITIFNGLKFAVTPRLMFIICVFVISKFGVPQIMSWIFG